MENCVLEVKNLSVILDSEVILKDISFAVKKGEALAIIGPNGAGKTVLFRALAGLLPHKGEIHWADKMKIGYAPQKFLVDKSIPITVKEFFSLKSKNFWLLPKDFAEHLSHELELVGLDKGILNKPIAEISGGQMQRVLIAWAMLDHPDILLFDEPTAGIDVGFEETIYHLLRKLQKERGTTVLLISHELNIVYKYADSVLCLNKKMICHGSPAEVLNPQELAGLYGEGGFYKHLN
ncbi:MAG: metal ABC transporter ATP-binding protein [bacterium]|nr:metal ABC transporter ATP-binding protein [bacterium]